MGRIFFVIREKQWWQSIVYSIVLKSKELFSKINLIIENKIKELGCSVIEYKITAEQSELLKETNSNGFNEHSIRMEKEL